MNFDYTKGKEARYKVSVFYDVQDDFYYFSDFESATALYNKVVEENESNLARVVLRDLHQKGLSAVLARFSKFDEARDSRGVQIAYYEPKPKEVYILSSSISPSIKAPRQERLNAYNMPFDERIERYATDEHKTIIKAFITKHAGAELSEFTNI